MSTVDRLRSWAEGGHGAFPWTILSIAPVVGLYAVVALLPMAFAGYASVHEIGLLDPDWRFVGLRNYVLVLGMDAFWASLWRGLVYGVGSTLFQLGIGVWMALVLHRLRNRLLSAIVFNAFLVPVVVISLLTLFLFNTWTGAFHVVGTEWLGLWNPDHYALGRRGDLALWTVILVGTWKYAAFVTIFTLAQLRSIPPKLYHAAQICGANRWQQFRDITFPRIRGVVLVVALLRLVFTFNQFDIIFLLTGGGPQSATTTLPLLAYGIAFGAGSYGLANAVAVVMFLALSIGAVAFFYVFRPSEEVETET